jgi:hypothetical protein
LTASSGVTSPQITPIVSPSNGEPNDVLSYRSQYFLVVVLWKMAISAVLRLAGLFVRPCTRPATANQRRDFDSPPGLRPLLLPVANNVLHNSVANSRYRQNAFAIILRWPGRSCVLRSPGDGESEARRFARTRELGPALASARAFALHALTFSQRVGRQRLPNSPSGISGPGALA